MGWTGLIVVNLLFLVFTGKYWTPDGCKNRKIILILTGFIVNSILTGFIIKIELYASGAVSVSIPVKYLRETH